MGQTQASDKLCYAIETKDERLVNKILDKFPHILELPFQKGGKLNPLILSVWRGDEELTKYFIKQGADPNLFVNGGHRLVTFIELI